MPIFRYTTALIDLSKSEEELWKSIQTRTDVRKAEKNGVTVERTERTEDVQAAYALYLDMMRKKSIPVERSYQLDLKKGVLLIGKYEGKLISYIFLTPSKSFPNALGFETIATQDEYKWTSVNSLLYWESIRVAKKLGYDFLNLVGVRYLDDSDPELKKLAFFKQKWGGEEKMMESEVSWSEYLYRKYLKRFSCAKKITYWLRKTFFADHYLSHS